MSYEKGLINLEQAEELRRELSADGFTVCDGKGLYEVFQVQLNGRFYAVTKNARGVISTPIVLGPLISAYLGGKSETKTITVGEGCFYDKSGVLLQSQPLIELLKQHGVNLVLKEYE